MAKPTRKYYFFFDYIYYRVTKAYFRWDGKSAASGLTAVTMIQSMMIFISITPIVRVYDIQMSKNVISSFVLLIIAILSYINYRKFGGVYNALNAHWKKEEKSLKRLKGFLVLVTIIAPWILLITVSNMLADS